ncbi:MAG: PVC-type heme-binding CxxCH protein [Tunicatimonas sp.]
MCFALCFALIILNTGCSSSDEPALHVRKGSHVVLVGNNLPSRMMHYGRFETELQLRYPDSLLFIRNMGDGGNTPGFRPHSARESPWAFPEAKDFYNELAENSGSQGHFPSPDEWLTQLRADVIIAFFGYNESFKGEAGLDNFRAELNSFVEHTLRQSYNGATPPQLALVSPLAFEDLSEEYDLPHGERENKNLQQYTEAIRQVAAHNNVPFVDIFNLSQQWYAESEETLTIDGFQLNDAGYTRLATLLTDRLFGSGTAVDEANRGLVHAAVQEKNWMWHQDFKIPNGVHAYGRRYDPFGPDNYPYEIAKIREMTALRDQAIWRATQGQKMDLSAADQTTDRLPTVKTNYDSGQSNDTTYLYGSAALEKLHAAPGYKIEMFASEETFANLANPVQLSFDNQGRLWVATMPSYPHYRPGDQKPNDKLIILEDTDGDGKADKETVFAEGLHLPLGFELAPEGVYLSQGTNLMLLTDTDGDDRADTREVLLSGFDDHDTHHAHSAYTADPSGAIYMAEGIFLHTNVETPYGPVRATNGGFYRYQPQRHQLERTAQLPIPNPWGIAFDAWGQTFFASTSNPNVHWMMPGTVKPRYATAMPTSRNLVEEDQRVRPTSGLEFVSSRHFPDAVQGDWLINNTIGFLGAKQHTLVDDGTGYHSEHRQDLYWSDDQKFRPVDMEFAPDGSLYVVDWHNVLIGHMQHNARDPLRDHVHGRIYRITYPSRPLVKPANIAGAPIDTLLNNLKLPEYRSRYRTRRELRGRDAPEVQAHRRNWIDRLDPDDARYEHHLLEALWVSWGLNQVDQRLLRQLLWANDPRVRAAAVRVLRYTGHQVEDQAALLKHSAGDENGRVRLESIAASSWLDQAAGLAVLEEAGRHPIDGWMKDAYETAEAHLNDRALERQSDEMVATRMAGPASKLFKAGEEIYSREGYCSTCHQPDGQGLTASGFPPLKGTPWVLGSEERLIKVVLNGLHGPMEVLGKSYTGQVPMTPFGRMLNDEEIASVLTYVRNSFGNVAAPVMPEAVTVVREATKDKTGFYSPQELLKAHPLED